jgi:hypothetical protein
MERELVIVLTSMAQSGLSISSGTIRIFDIGYGLNGLQKHQQFEHRNE